MRTDRSEPAAASLQSAACPSCVAEPLTCNTEIPAVDDSWTYCKCFQKAVCLSALQEPSTLWGGSVAQGCRSASRKSSAPGCMPALHCSLAPAALQEASPEHVHDTGAPYYAANGLHVHIQVAVLGLDGQLLAEPAQSHSNSARQMSHCRVQSMPGGAAYSDCARSHKVTCSAHLYR